MNQRFYNQTLPRLVFETPLQSDDYSYSFNSSVFLHNFSVVVGYPKLESPTMFVGNGRQADKKYRILNDVLI